jgi:quercetin dioxygenase-like cupin family protein
MLSSGGNKRGAREMGSERVVRSAGGRRFKLGEDVYTIKRPALDTGATSLTHLTVAAGAFVPPHTHERYEETFYVLDGELEFTLGEETFPVAMGDYICAGPGVRHAFANKSGRAVHMLFEFTPGGMEELFYEFRTDDGPIDAAAYLAKARDVHGTVYELPDRPVGG